MMRTKYVRSIIYYVKDLLGVLLFRLRTQPACHDGVCGPLEIIHSSLRPSDGSLQMMSLASMEDMLYSLVLSYI